MPGCLRLSIAFFAFVVFQLTTAQVPQARRPGPLPDGGQLLSTGWRLKPAGQQIPVDTFPVSSLLSPDGRYLLVLHAGHNPPSIGVIDLSSGRVTSRMPVPDAGHGFTMSPKGDRVYAGGGAQAAVYEFSFAGGVLKLTRTFSVTPAASRTPRNFIGDVTLSPDGRLIYAAELFGDAVAVINPQSGMVIERLKTGRRPFRILFHPDGKSFFVTSWADGSLGHYDTATGDQLAAIRLGPHPTDMVWRPGKNEAAERDPAWDARLFVAAANTNNVYMIGVSESQELRLAGTINVSMTPGQPLGMTPSGLALSADNNLLYAVCSDGNAVAVVNVSEPHSRVIGFIPTGWYPTAARALPDGRLAILNGKSGTVSVIDRLTERNLDEHTETTLANAPSPDKLAPGAAQTSHPIPSAPGDPSAIQHVIYIASFSSRPPVAGGGSNEIRRKIASNFVRFSNFHTEAATSVETLFWATAGIAPAYVQRYSPAFRAGRLANLGSEGQEPVATPPAGFLWSSAASAGIALRNYGFWVANTAKPAGSGMPQIESVRDPVLQRITNRNFRGPDPEYPDPERAKIFLGDLAEFEKAGQMPRLILLRLDADAPDHDRALGRIVEGVSKSRFWPQTAMFILDAGEAFVASPYAKRAAVDGTMYHSTSILRTMELILGLRPMTVFDAAARAMSAAFQATPVLTPYTAEEIR
jgi:DNA-binding beta-propeller fold protein YncE